MCQRRDKTYSSLEESFFHEHFLVCFLADHNKTALLSPY